MLSECPLRLFSPLATRHSPLSSLHSTPPNHLASVDSKGLTESLPAFRINTYAKTRQECREIVCDPQFRWNDSPLRDDANTLFVYTLLPLCFQSLPGCSSRNPFLFTLLHCCPGVAPHSTLFYFTNWESSRPRCSVLGPSFNFSSFVFRVSNLDSPFPIPSSPTRSASCHAHPQVVLH